MLAEAIAFAAQKHVGQVDKCGQPFIGHPLRVMAYLAQDFTIDPTILSAAVLHDVLEDTDTSKAELANAVGWPVTEIVIHLTRSPHETYRNYIDRLLMSDRWDVLIVKISDLSDNMDETRVTPEFRDEWLGMKAKRYQPAIDLLVARAAALVEGGA